MRRPMWLATGLVLALLISVSACSDDDPPPSADHRSTTTRATSSTSSTTTTTTKPKSGYVKAKVDPSLPRQDIDINLRYPASFTPAQVEVVQAWANYRHVFYAVSDPPDPSSSFLRMFETAQVLVVNRAQIADLKAKGMSARIRGYGSLRETVQRVEVSGDSAVLTTCQVDGVALVRTSDSAVVDDDVVTKHASVSLSRNRASSAWQVSPPPAVNLGRWDGDEEDRCGSA